MIWGDDDIANQVDEIFVVLPEPNIDTDEDSVDEDNGGMLHNLTGPQLRSAVELKLTNNDRLPSNYEYVFLTKPQQQLSTSANQTIGNQSKTSSILQAQLIPKQDQKNWIDDHPGKKKSSNGRKGT
ncbi:hypothetical protein JTB14_000612 [Gonioctena quinquepunctata]|nr:hypothetical protein JTB14_000612 [Gonioctena quinquepunctata]